MTDIQPQTTKDSVIVHIAPTPFFANRGCHIRILNEIRGLQEKEIPVILCTYGLGTTPENLDIRRIPQIPGYRKTSAGFSPFKPLADILLWFLVIKTIIGKKSVILHGHLHEGGLIGWCCKTLLFWKKIHLIMDIQGSLSGELSEYGTFRRFPFLLTLFYLLEKLICLMPDKIVCSSLNSYQFITRECGVPAQRLSMLPDVVPSQFLHGGSRGEMRQKYAIGDDEKVLVYSGSLLQGKGVDLMLDALRIADRQLKDCCFLLVGYPKEWVEDSLAKQPLTNRAIITGEVPYQELKQWLSMADLGVDPKLAEKSGEASGKILHYMAMGVPVVCFESEANTGLLNGNCFYAVEQTPEALSQAILTGFADPTARAAYSQTGRQKITDHYSVSATADTLESLYSVLAVPSKNER